MSIDDRPTVSAPDDDPYLWLEEIEGERALAFVAQQNERTFRCFADAAFAGDRDALAAILDRPDNIPSVSRRGGLLYNLWKDAAHPRGLWRHTTLDEYRNSTPQWEVLLDLDRLAADENEDWALNWVQGLPPAHRLAMLSLSRGGSDAVVLREFDLTTKRFVADGFMLGEAKGSADWLDQDTLLLSSAHGAGMATASGYARTVRLWRRGQDISETTVIFEGRSPDPMWVHAAIDRTAGVPRVWFIERLDFFNQHVWLGDSNGAREKLDLPNDAQVEVHGDWLAVKLRRAWTIGATTHPADSVLGISLTAFLAGSREFQTLFEPGPRRALQGLFWAGGSLVLSILDDLKPLHHVCTPGPEGWRDVPLPGLPDIGVVTVGRFDSDETESNGDLVAYIQDPLTPPSLGLIEGVSSPAILKQAPSAFSADGLRVTRHEAISVDGARIPISRPAPLKRPGTRRCT